MPIDYWSDNIVLAELQNDPSFSDDLTAVTEQSESRTDVDVILDLGSVSYLNSSNIARLLRLRKQLHARGRRLVLCGVNATVWGLFLVTGLEKVFEFTDNKALALATVQLAAD